MTGNPLKIIHVTSADRMIYGAVQSMMTLAQAQRDHGDAVSFVGFSGKAFGNAARSVGYTVQDFPVRLKLDPVAIVKMRNHFRTQQADVVHTHLSTSSLNGCFAARLARIPCVASVHGMSGKLSFVFADHLIGVSNGVKAHLVAQGVSAAKITAVYNGVEVPRNQPTKQEARALLGLPLGGTFFGTVARLTDLKGIQYGLEAFAIIAKQVPDAHYLLVGDGESAQEYMAWVVTKGLSDRVHFVGYQQDVFSALAAMDLFLFPSLKEAMGIAVVEALACGLPIISTDVGGLPEVVVSEVGRLVPPRDAVALAEAAIEIATSNQMLQMSQNARRRAQQLFSIDAMRSGTALVYDSLLTRRVTSGLEH